MVTVFYEEKFLIYFTNNTRKSATMLAYFGPRSLISLDNNLIKFKE